jgi:hypothetical protein
VVWRDQDGFKGFIGVLVDRALNVAGILVGFFALIYLLVFFTGAFTGNTVGVSWWQALVAGVVLGATVRLLVVNRRRRLAGVSFASHDPYRWRVAKRDEYYWAQVNKPISIERGVVGFTDTAIRFGSLESGDAEWRCDVPLSEIAELSYRTLSGDVRGRLRDGEELSFTIRAQMTPMKDLRASNAMEAVLAEI